MQRTSSETTTGVVQRLLGNIAAMLQTYALLAGEELRGSIRSIVTGVILFAAALVLGALALAMIVVTAVLALSTVMAPWLASLVVLGVTLVVAVVLALIGIRRFRPKGVRKVMTAFKEDIAWLRNELTTRS
jgi:hypothetical protein